MTIPMTSFSAEKLSSNFLFDVQLFLNVFFFAAPVTKAGPDVPCWRGRGGSVYCQRMAEIEVAEAAEVERRSLIAAAL
jgi:hypothetical protein